MSLSGGARLQQVGEVSDSQSIEVGIVSRDRFPANSRRIPRDLGSISQAIYAPIGRLRVGGLGHMGGTSTGIAVETGERCC